MKWLLIAGIVLLAGWYILAPLFTPSALRDKSNRRLGHRCGGPDLIVGGGAGRIVDDETE